MFARSTVMGNAKASESGTSNSTALTLFLCSLINADEGSPAAKTIYDL